jgi:hypothetical protein
MVRFPIRPVKENLWNWYCHPQMISLFFGLWPWSHKACIALNIVCSIYSIYMPTNHKFYSSICRVTANVSVLGDKLSFHALIQILYLISYFQKNLSFKKKLSWNQFQYFFLHLAVRFWKVFVSKSYITLKSIFNRSWFKQPFFNCFRKVSKILYWLAVQTIEMAWRRVLDLFDECFF